MGAGEEGTGCEDEAQGRLEAETAQEEAAPGATSSGTLACGHFDLEQERAAALGATRNSTKASGEGDTGLDEFAVGGTLLLKSADPPCWGSQRL